jgi:hypothetical protein
VSGLAFVKVCLVPGFATVEVHGEHLAFLDAAGKLAALFLIETAKSWNVLSAAT